MYCLKKVGFPSNIWTMIQVKIWIMDHDPSNIPASRNKQNAIETLIYLITIIHVAIRIADCIKTKEIN